MRTHPLVVVGGILQHNPFFVPPGSSCMNFAHGGQGSLRGPRR